MPLQDFITAAESSVSAVVASKLNLKTNEAAAVAKLIAGAFELVEAEALNRGLSTGLADLAKAHPQIAAAIESVPQVKALLPAAQ